MTQWGYEDSNDDMSQGDNIELNGPKALREAYKAQQEMLKQIQQELTQERQARQKEKLATVFESLGVPGAQNVYQGEPDPEKAKEWVTTMQSVFGNGNVQGSTPPVADTQPAISADEQARLQRMTEAGQHGAPVGGFEAAAAAVGDATDLQSLIAAMGRANMG